MNQQTESKNSIYYRLDNKENVMKKEMILNLPEEFLEICARDGVDPETVIKGFIADVSGITNWIYPNPSEGRHPRIDDGYNSNGSDERLIARNYYERCGYNDPESYKGKIKIHQGITMKGRDR